MSTNTVQAQDILRQIQSLTDRIKLIEGLLQGQPFGTVRIKDAAITNAKIVSVSADKITTGQLSVLTTIDLGDTGSGNYIRQDGGNVRFLMYRASIPQFIIGEQ
jgi:hypothetical protein